jgi:hypothetical protein
MLFQIIVNLIIYFLLYIFNLFTLDTVKNPAGVIDAPNYLPVVAGGKEIGCSALYLRI